MTRLLIVTDNTFYRSGQEVFDDLCYDRGFFDDYAAVFDEVRVAARVDRTGRVDGLIRADGAGVSFVDLDDVHGAAWVLAPWRLYCRPLADAVDWADAVCVRLPSVAGWHAARLARRLGRPLMFELIGDPLATGVTSTAHRLSGMIQHRRTCRIVRWSGVGSYVSRAHLQQRYPASFDATTASISSIRLPLSGFRAPRAGPAQPDRLRLILVAAFLPYKNHKALLDAMALALRQRLRLSLTLVGDGPLRPAIERQIERMGLGDHVRLTGMLTGRAKIEAELDAADLFVMPSWSEGLPRAAIEAMARGLPVIGSGVPGIRELLPQSSLFDPGRPEQIAALIGRLRIAANYRQSSEQSVRIAREFVADVISPRRQALYRRFREIALERMTCWSLDAALAGGAAR
jgi:glycosyltransferase involved in cell wall biosynthesis